MRLAIVAALAFGLQLVAAAALHSTFACTASAHGQSSEHAGHHPQDGARHDRPPACCQQPVTIAGIQTQTRSENAAAIEPAVVAAVQPAIVEWQRGSSDPGRLVAVHGPPGRSLRAHLLFETFLL